MDTFPPLVQSALSKMDGTQKLTFETEYENRKRKTAGMVIATILFVHFFFYRRIFLGIIYLICLFTVFGFVWWIIELCLIRSRLKEHNGRVAVDLAREMSLMSA